MNSLDYEPRCDNKDLFDISEVEVEEIVEDAWPLSLQRIRWDQLSDEKFQKEVKSLIMKQRPSRFTKKEVDGVKLIHEYNRILVPQGSRHRLLEWYHQHLCHPVSVQQEQTMRSVFAWRNMQNDIEAQFKHCHVCQRNKKTRKNKYGKIPKKLAEITKWRRVNVDCWGPKTINNKNKFTYQIYVMSMMDPVTGWVELAQLYGPPTAYKCQQLLDSVWLSRYPRPEEIGMDNGGEFKAEFNELCKNIGLKRKESNSWNPQSNLILK